MIKENDFFFGVNAVLEKLKSAANDIAEIVLIDKPLRPVLREIEARARHGGIAVTYSPVRTLDRLAQGQNHQGVLARVQFYSYLPFSQLLNDISSSPGPELILVLDGLTDPGNLGALLRTSEAVGVRYIVLPKDRSAAVSPAVAKASAGAIHHLKVCRVTNLRRALSDLKNQEFWTVGLDPKAADSIYDKHFPQKLAIVLGSEGSGIRPLVLKECDYRVSIPMRGKLGSLNVSVAGGVFLYEIFRQSRDVDMDWPKRY
ncbi:MAG: 23S rRNA (guanosine(2251)-2'-O)-methyltransferase RlmB [Candidatus Binatia bacterium]